MEQRAMLKEALQANPMPVKKIPIQIPGTLVHAAGNQAALNALSLTPPLQPEASITHNPVKFSIPQTGASEPVIQCRGMELADLDQLITGMNLNSVIPEADRQTILELTLSKKPFDFNLFFTWTRTMTEVSVAVIGGIAVMTGIVLGGKLRTDLILVGGSCAIGAGGAALKDAVSSDLYEKAKTILSCYQVLSAPEYEGFNKIELLTAYIEGSERSLVRKNAKIWGEQDLTVGPDEGHAIKRTKRELIEYLNPGARIIVLNCMERLLRITTDSCVSAVLEGANMNVSNPILHFFSFRIESDMPQLREQAAFAKRVELLTRFIEGVGDTNIRTTEGLKKLHEVYWIESTGSDPHKDGRHALFLINKATNEQLVYKPRSLKADEVAAGTDGVVSKLESKKDLFPRMSFGKKLAQDQIENPFVEEMMVRTGKTPEEPVTWEKALEFFCKLGELYIITAVSGITDLHADNIIFTEQGPVIVDGECSFAQYGDPLLEGSSGPYRREFNSAQTGFSESLFFLETKDKNVYHSVKAYKLFPELQEAYLNGKRNSLRHILDKKQDIKENFLQSTEQANNMRIVPISTRTLGVELSNFIIKENERDAIVTDLANTVLDHLKTAYVFSRAAAIHYEPLDTIKGLLRTAFEAKTIPALYIEKLEFKKWRIDLDENPIATIDWSADPRETMEGLFDFQFGYEFNKTNLEQEVCEGLKARFQDLIDADQGNQQKKWKKAYEDLDRRREHANEKRIKAVTTYANNYRTAGSNQDPGAFIKNEVAELEKELLETSVN